ncbi:MAG: sulfatase/phosphatase domain-containing protein, partial [Verrucomicrobiota bacterium]
NATKLAELEDAGLADDTIVFFYSDHGSGLPRHKRLLHDSGMQVALMVRFPEKYQHLAPASPGSVIDDLVSFVDFTPSVLHMAGVAIPNHMQGTTLLTAEASSLAKREVIYGTRDRVDEVFDCSRSVRNKKYLYIRNYMPHLSWNQPSVFSDLAEMRRSITKVAADDWESLSPAQQHYAGPTKSIEEFYDIQADPANIVNLLDYELTAGQQKELDALRAALVEQRMSVRDAGAINETTARNVMAEEQATLLEVLAGKSDHAPDLKAAWEAADQVGKASKDDLLAMLGSGDESVRFWGVIGLRVAHGGDAEIHDRVVDHLEDVAGAVRIETAHWLAADSEKYHQAALKQLVADTGDAGWWTALRAVRSIELLGEKARSVLPEMKVLYAKTRNSPGDQNFFIAFSSGAFLDKLGEETQAWDFSPGAGSFSADKKKEKQ